jgi:hypothetical protein
VVLLIAWVNATGILPEFLPGNLRFIPVEPWIDPETAATLLVIARFCQDLCGQRA